MRTETRYEFTDNLNYSAGNHTFKFGGDLAFVRIPSAIFQLNFAGLFNFGGLSALTLGGFPVPGVALPGDCQRWPPTVCRRSSSSAYGLGFPTNYIQGFGDPVSRIKTHPLPVAQDSWKIRPNLTLNYGTYDVEIPQTIAG